jgi:hypothetical protein
VTPAQLDELERLAAELQREYETASARLTAKVQALREAVEKVREEVEGHGD